MFDFYERRKFRRILYSNGALVVLLVITIVLSRGVYNIYIKERETTRITAEKEAKLKSLAKREAALSTELNRLATDRGVEEELRQKYDVAKPGEHVIVLAEAPKDNQQPTWHMELVPQPISLASGIRADARSAFRLKRQDIAFSPSQYADIV